MRPSTEDTRAETVQLAVSKLRQGSYWRAHVTAPRRPRLNAATSGRGACQVARVPGGNNYHLQYTRLFGDLLVEGSYSKTMAKRPSLPRGPARATTSSSGTPTFAPSLTSSWGGFGRTDLDQRDTEGFKGPCRAQPPRKRVAAPQAQQSPTGGCC